jgi:protein-disulfide isomerase
MKARWWLGASAASLCFVYACGTSQKPEVAAKVGARTISVAELDASIRQELARIEAERYDARKQMLDQIIDDLLLEEKAKSLGITKDELVKREVSDKVQPPTDDEVKAMFAKLKAPSTTTLEQLSPRIREVLTSQATTARRKQFLSQLRQDEHVQVSLEPPRFRIDTATGHAEGSKDAPIELIEFSDYQCPYCGRSQDTVDKVLSTYKSKIHHVFMDFPLSAIHPLAKPAAVASHCAEEQNKFQEYHDTLFARQKELGNDNFKKWAGELGLDTAAFEECVGSKKFDDRIQQSLAAGEAVGITGTPGFFVNGIAIKGAQPFEVFQRTIDEELAHAK